MQSIISTFHIDWKIIIAQIVNFGVVFVVLYIYALKPLSKLMSERSEKIENGIKDAKTNAETLKATEKEYEKVLQKAKIEANTIFQNSKKEAEVKKTQMLEDAKTEVTTMIENGKKTLNIEKVKIVEEARGEIVALTMQATEKLLQTRADGHFDTKVIKDIKNL